MATPAGPAMTACACGCCADRQLGCGCLAYSEDDRCDCPPCLTVQHGTYRVLLVDARGLHDWQPRPVDGSDPAMYSSAKAARTGEVPFLFTASSFLWLCPGCGNVRAGLLGDEPVSGWDNPRWVKTGTDEKPTLLPSLGCGAWRNGVCPAGHWWLRAGELVPA